MTTFLFFLSQFVTILIHSGMQNNTLDLNGSLCALWSMIYLTSSESEVENAVLSRKCNLRLRDRVGLDNRCFVHIIYLDSSQDLILNNE